MKEMFEIILKASQMAAISSYKKIGCADEKEADQAATNMMRKILSNANIAGKIVIGEGERDEAPMLYIGENLGYGTYKIDIAVDPLEGTTLCAYNMPGAICVIAATEEGGLLNAPDIYMEKIVLPKNANIDYISLSQDINLLLTNIAKAVNKTLEDLHICVLDRQRHEYIINAARKYNIKISKIKDGDIAAAIATAHGQYDAYLGIGGAPEGVLAAAALKILGAKMLGKLTLEHISPLLINKLNKDKLNLEKEYREYELCSGEKIVFVASGVTSGDLLQGVVENNDAYITNSLVLTSYSQEGKLNKSIRNIEEHFGKYETNDN